MMKNIFRFILIPFSIGCFAAGMIFLFNIQNVEAEEKVIEAEDMQIKTTGGPCTDGWNIWSNGYIAEPDVDFSTEGVFIFNVIAKGSFAGGAWPIMEVRIDQTVAESVTVDSSSWNTYSVEAYVNAGKHEVAIAFTNDYYNPPEDRNLYVDKVGISISTSTVDLESGLIAYWQFEEESGINVYDSTINNNDGVLQNSDGDERIESKSGFGKALDLDGIDDYVSVPLNNGLNITGNQITLSAWARVPDEGVDNDEALINKIPVDTDDWGNYPYMIGMQDSGDPDFDETNCRISTSLGNVRVNIAAVPRGVWVHLACTYDGSNVKTYVNGMLINTTALQGDINNGSDIRLGARRDNRRYEGDMDELRVYNRALSQEEIITLFNFQPPENSLGVSLSADPVLGSSPLNDIDLEASIFGAATGTIDYTFYCNNPAEGTIIEPGYDFRIIGVNPDGTGGIVEEQGNATKWGINKGKILREWWSGISGENVSDLTSSADYPNNPTGSGLIDSFEGPTNIANDYGTRIQGFLYPESTGSYTFWIAGDDNSELWLSTDASSANAVKIAEVPGWTRSEQWDKYSAQQSAPIALQAGQKYYIMALHKEGKGGDNIAVAWQGPGISQEVIPGAYLSPPGGNVFTVSNLCDYDKAGDYVAKVIVERGDLQTEDRIGIKVNPFKMGGLWGHYSTPLDSDFSQYAKLYTGEMIENIDFDNFEAVLLSRTGQGNDAKAIWSGSIFAETAGWYNFHFLGQGRQRVYLNIYDYDEREINYYNSSHIDVSKDIYLSSGWHGINVTCAVYPGASGSWIKLFWTPPGGREEIIPGDHLSPEYWSDKIIAIPDLSKPKAQIDYIVTGVGAAEAESGANIVIDLKAAGISIDDVVKDEVWVFAGYSPNETGHSVTNNITGRTENITASRLVSSTGWPINIIETKLPESLVDDGGTGRLDFTFNLDFVNHDTGKSRPDGIALVIPYINDKLGFVARLYIRARGHSNYQKASPVYLFPISGELYTEDIRPFFVFGDGETRLTMFDSPPKYRPNYMYYISGNTNAGELPPSEFEVIQNMPGAVRMMPVDDGPPVLSNSLSWYPAFGREGPQMDVVSQNYVPNVAPGVVSGGGELPLLSIDSEDNWIAFQAYSLHFNGDNVSNGTGESTFMLGGGIVSTEPIEKDFESESPTATDLSVIKGDYCSSISHFFSWTYSDPDGDSESRFQFQADNNSDFSSPEIDRDYTGLSYPSPTTNNQTTYVAISPGSDQLAYNTTYYWRVKVYDSKGNDSGWVSGSSFSTEGHHYPIADFSWSPTSIAVGDEVDFIDESVCYDDSNNPSPCAAWIWDIPDANYINGTNSTSQNPSVKFTSIRSETVSLWVDDGRGCTCSEIKSNINIKMPLPSWKEVSP